MASDLGARPVVSDGETRARFTASPWQMRVLQFVVSVGLLAALIMIVDWSRLRDAASALSPGGLILVFAVGLIAQAAFVLRWRALLDMLGVRETWGRSWHSVFAALFLTNFLPGTLGSDGLRVVLLTKSCGRASTAIGAVAYERLMQLAIYVCLVSVAALLPMPWLQPWLRAAIVGLGISAVLVLIFILYWLGQRSVESGAAGGSLVQTGWRLFATILTETGRMQTRMRRHRRAALGFWVASIVNVSLVVLMWRIVLWDIGEDIGAPATALVAGGAMIVGAVPISLNGLGTFEAANVALLGLAGVTASHAFLLALIVRAALMASSFVGLPSAVLLWRERGS
jgi:uncharacterized protein (TIRG00374 family)